MNASGRLNTCKSSEKVPFGELDSGARVSNAYAIYLLQEDSPGKLGLILHGLYSRHRDKSKVPTVKDERA